MNLADKCMALQFGSPKLDELRSSAIKGSPDALLEYVYYCAWLGIRADKYIPPKKKAAVFRQLVDSNMFEVSLAPNEGVKNG